jgi:RimJ/RimL family protein N-acetyltransferase
MPDLKPVTITTERLKLRWLDERDVAAHYAVMSDPTVARYWSSEPWTEIGRAGKAISDAMSLVR